MTPRFLTSLVGFRVLPQKDMMEEIILERCLGVPNRMYSVFDGFTQSLLSVSQEYTELSEEESYERAKSESEQEKEM